MPNKIEFDREKAKEFVQGWGLWPMTERAENTMAQQWWRGVLERVLWAVNEHDWNDEAYPEDKYTEMAESAVSNQVSVARENKRVMTICEISEIHKVVTDPFDDGIYSRLTAMLMEVKGDEGEPYRYSGETSDEADERRRRARREHKEQCGKLLTLTSVTEIYLEAAANDVARAWCEALVEEWLEANPEDDEDEDEEE